VETALQAGDPPPSALTADERRAYEQLQAGSKQRGYATEMGTRPQTLSGLADSPLGLATWMLDHDAGSEQEFSRAIVDGRAYGAITREDLIDNITLYSTSSTRAGTSRRGSSRRLFQKRFVPRSDRCASRPAGAG
jgi:hypothetical protein